ncbi:MAG: YeeE/YedE thiosulfate transporter family protein [Enterobacterales bacterium]|nr:YeeE/YedE thiosulfate transporter family protein [Enterobacterales bacterium]
MRILIALVSGLLFGIGLTVSQMVNPQKVLSFLDVFGDWDASLLVVMGAAFSVFSLSYWLFIHNRKLSLTGSPIASSNPAPINKQLIMGAVIFGVGWGMTGLCPGPVLANLSGGDIKIVVFALVMLLGMKTSDWVKARYLQS